MFHGGLVWIRWRCPNTAVKFAFGKRALGRLDQAVPRSGLLG